MNEVDSKPFVGVVAKQARQAYYLSATYVANFCGISCDELLAIENECATPPENVVSKLVTLYGYERQVFFSAPATPLEAFFAWQKEVSNHLHTTTKGEDLYENDANEDQRIG